jgi:hypothetical protein
VNHLRHLSLKLRMQKDVLRIAPEPVHLTFFARPAENPPGTGRTY